MYQAIGLEREAHRLRAEGKIEQAFLTFDQAARLFKEVGEHLKSAVCYASAATCWDIHIGRQPLKNAATRNEFAAVQAFKAKDYGYAETLFAEAALLYEREGDFLKYSRCYERAKDAWLHSLWDALTEGDKKAMGGQATSAAGSRKEKIKLVFQYLMSLLSQLIWGHGERPFRTLAIACGVILVSAILYRFSGLIISDGFLQNVNFWESLYLSIVTYTTVGFGDYLPFGWVRAVAALEALSGIFLTPLFLIALARRYLRINR